MTTLREAAQQALEALKKYRHMMFVEAGCRFGEGDAAITALSAALAQQAEPVTRGAAYGNALRWAIKACGAVQRDDGVWFGDDAAARLARILSEGISPPQQTEQERGMAQPSERTNGQQTARRIA